MHLSLKKHLGWGCAVALTALLASGPAAANGPIGDHVNALQEHLSQYTEEVNWLVDKADGIVDSYEAGGSTAADPDAMIEHWESVAVHSAIETQFVPVYASIWQGIYGIKTAIDNGQPVADVRAQQINLEQALWQGLGAVKLAAQYQQKGLLAEVKTTADAPTTPDETLDDIKHRLDTVVAKYAEQLHDAAKTIVHDTYLHRFEGIEGALIEQDAALVEDLEKDFNVTLPMALDGKTSVDAVRKIVQDMHLKLERARTLLKEAEKNRKDVF